MPACFVFLCLAAWPVLAADFLRVASTPEGISRTAAGNSFLPVVSPNGHQAVFISSARNLVTNDDSRAYYDIFARQIIPEITHYCEIITSNTVLVSVNMSGTGGGNDHSLHPAVSSNGLLIAFESAASDLVPNDTNRASDVFVRDLTGGITLLASVSTDGVSSGNGPSMNARISADGRFVAFESSASNLVSNDHNNATDVFLRDLLTGTTALVSIDADGSGSGNGPSHSPSISADGRYVAFASHATNLVSGPKTNVSRVYARDLLNGKTIWASGFSSPFCNLPPPVELAEASQPILSRGGRFVAYNAAGQAVVRYDLQGGTNTSAWRWTSASVGEEPLVISDDGRYIAFATALTNCCAVYPTNNVYRMDAETTSPCACQTNFLCGSLELVSAGLPNRTFAGVGMSRDGQSIAFVSITNAPTAGAVLHVRQMLGGQTGLLPIGGLLSSTLPAVFRLPAYPAFVVFNSATAWMTNDLNRAHDVFILSSDFGKSGLISERHGLLPSPTTGTGPATLYPQAWSANGERLVFGTHDNTLVRNDTNGFLDLMLHNLVGGTNSPVSGPRFTYGSSASATNLLQTNSALSSAVSADGRFVTFDLSLGKPNSSTNAYRFDRQTRTLEVVSRDRNNNPLTGSASSLSADGRFVAFHSTFAANLFGDFISDTNGAALDVIVRDFGDPWAPPRRPDDPNPSPIKNEVVSVNRSGNRTGNRASWQPAISPDGEWVVFQSLATDLTTNALGSFPSPQLFARRRSARHTKLISRETNGVALAGGAMNPVFSSDSRYVVFQSATNFTLYRHDLVFDAIVTVTNLAHPSQPPWYRPNIVFLPNEVVCTGCANPSLNANGRLVAYETRSSAGPGNVFLRDLASMSEELISVNVSGTGGGDGDSSAPLLSYDGRYVVFASKASNLVTNDFNGRSDVFVRDRWKGITLLISRNSSGRSGNGPSSRPVLSPDGRTIAFQSFATDLVAGDYNGLRDIFILQLSATDLDGDQLDDDWEQTYFSTLGQNGADDFDSDGYTNLAEFQAGTDPTDAASLLEVLSFRAYYYEAQGAYFTDDVLSWRASPGRAYRVQYMTNLNSLAWSNLSGDVISGGATASRSVTVQHDFLNPNVHRFYRVLLLPGN